MPSEDKAAAKQEDAGNNPGDGEIDRPLIGLTIAYLAADYVTRAMPLYFGVVGEHATAIGAGMSLVLIAAVLYIHTWLRADVGLTLVQRPKSVGFSITAVFLLGLVGACFGMMNGTEAGSGLKMVRTVALSPISEELAYRGIGLAALCRAIPCLGMFWPILITSVGFSLIHTPFREGGSLSDFTWFGYFALMGVILGVIRLKSGSLLFPILGHVALNGMIQLVAIARTLT